MAGQMSCATKCPGRGLLDLPADERKDFAAIVGWGARVGLITVMEARELTRQAEADPYSAADEVDRFDSLVSTGRAVRFEGDTVAADRLAKTYHKAMERATLVPNGDRWVRQENSLDLGTIRRRATRSVVLCLTSDEDCCAAH
ncbi:hypothetical protein [Propionibacterium sp.]|uniref:hypothetical protein n=1 Tax=Propionibacterium sp. TaxID=1977903 RepID=UPI0039ED1A81